MRSFILKGFMGRFKDDNNEALPFTQVPNEVCRNPFISTYTKTIFTLLASCRPSFPSYEQLMNWSGLSRDRVWKSLKELESLGLATRYTKGRATQYVLKGDEFTRLSREPDAPLQFGKPRTKKDIHTRPSHGTNSPPDGHIELLNSPCDGLNPSVLRTDEALTRPPDGLHKDVLKRLKKKSETENEMTDLDFRIFEIREQERKRNLKKGGLLLVGAPTQGNRAELKSIPNHFRQSETELREWNE